MVLGVRLGCFRGVMTGVVLVAVRHVRVMTGQVVVTGFMVACRFAMMPCGVFVVFRCFVMMLGCFLRHWVLLHVRFQHWAGRHKAEPTKLRPC